MDGKKRKTAVLTMAAVLSAMIIASPLAVTAQETALAAPAITRDGNVQKETAPAIRLPENLRAKAGTALKDVALPEPWTWADGSTVIPAETAEYPARLCVDDTTYDYSKVEGYNAGGGSYVERMVAVTAEAAKATNPVKGKPRGLPGDPPTTYAVGDIEINADNFPDAEFQNYIRNNFDNGDGKLSAAEIDAITRIDVHGETGIKSLTGIEHFTALETLMCTNTGIGSLDVSHNEKLTFLSCGDNASLTSLTVEGAAALTDLNCANTGIGSLDVSSNMKLENLYCPNTPSLTSLTVEGATALTYLYCANTGIGSLDVSSNKKLMTLRCENNASLTSLTVEGAEALIKLWCYNTGIGSLDVSSNKKLENMDCGNTTSLTNLKVEGAAALSFLDCDNTGIGSLDVSRNPNLTELDCSKNASLTSLTVEGAEALTELYCANTGIGSLDVSHNEKLKYLSCSDNASLTSLTVEGAEALIKLWCYNTGIGSLDVSSNKKLENMDCGNTTSLTNLKVEGAAALSFLDCDNTGIGSLDVSSNQDLVSLNCENNASLTNLKVEGAEALKSLRCFNTGIGSLDVSRNTELTYLNCSNNPLAYLNIGTNTNLNVDSTGLKPVEVTVPSDRFQMADKFAGIDAGAVDNTTVQGAVYDKTSGTMSNYHAGGQITYTYHCGTSSSGEVTIEVTLKITLESTITRTYTVEEKAPSGGVKDSDNNHDGTKTDKKAAQTDDPANVGVLAAMILLSAGCMFVLIRKKGQKK
ncbi:hypothetical protein NIA71_02430 [Ihubacter massiliensis]|uniref:hypothetical protein n=1 Tax=Ihubacter massiliensis TaxID=1852367 RepID=UPI0020973D9A|nr:hypothetical protein [Ihubacter massiliensis]MCO7120810.1 hypothetical protein [Ihubacter massiliensis]